MGIECRLYGYRVPVIWVLSAGYMGVERRLYGC